jgi:hypothetical protein
MSQYQLTPERVLELIRKAGMDAYKSSNGSISIRVHSVTAAIQAFIRSAVDEDERNAVESLAAQHTWVQSAARPYAMYDVELAMQYPKPKPCLLTTTVITDTRLVELIKKADLELTAVPFTKRNGQADDHIGIMTSNPIVAMQALMRAVEDVAEAHALGMLDVEWYERDSADEYMLVFLSTVFPALT